MLLSLREETEAKLQMLLSLRKNGLTPLFKEVRVFKGFGEALDVLSCGPKFSRYGHLSHHMPGSLSSFREHSSNRSCSRAWTDSPRAHV